MVDEKVTIPRRILGEEAVPLVSGVRRGKLTRSNVRAHFDSNGSAYENHAPGSKDIYTRGIMVLGGLDSETFSKLTIDQIGKICSSKESKDRLNEILTSFKLFA